MSDRENPQAHAPGARAADVGLDDLARAARAGGRREIERLLGALRPIVARWAVVLTGSPDAAEDVAQTVLLRVHASLHDYTPHGRFSAWLYRITRNVVADQRKRDRRHRARVEMFSREALAMWLGERRDLLELLGAADQLRRFMTRLSPRQRAVLDLVELQGYSTAEAADVLEISPATARVHLFRAKAAMGEAVHTEEQRRHHA